MDELRSQIDRSLCLHKFPCQQVERQMKPEVEVQTDPELVLPAVAVTTNLGACLIEQSINSTRISFKFNTSDEVEKNLVDKYLRFMLHRADDFEIIRRIAIEGCNITFLVTEGHIEKYNRKHIVDFIIQFITTLHSEMQSIEADIKARQVAVAAEWYKKAAEWFQP